MKKILWNLSSDEKENIETYNLLKSLKESYNEFEHYITGDNLFNIDSDIKSYDNDKVDFIINNSLRNVIIDKNSKVITKYNNEMEMNDGLINSNVLICDNDTSKKKLSEFINIDTEVIKYPIDIEYINNKRKDKTKPKIIYNHSVDKNEDYNKAFIKFVDVIKHLNERIAFKVDVLFIGNNSEIESLDLIFSNMDMINIIQKPSLNYSEYIDELWEGEIVVSTFDYNDKVEWSREIVDGIFTNNAILIPDNTLSDEIVDEQFKWKHNGDVIGISKKLLGLISNMNNIEINCTESKSIYINKYSNDSMVNKFYKLLK